jgi:hypothetical protein
VDPLHLDMASAEQTANNLGGSGPDNDPCNCLRYDGIGEYLGQPIDLIVTLVEGTSYNSPTGANRNVAEPRLGKLSVRNSEHVDVEFHFECVPPPRPPARSQARTSPLRAPCCVSTPRAEHEG